MIEQLNATMATYRGRFAQTLRRVEQDTAAGRQISREDYRRLDRYAGLIDHTEAQLAASIQA